MVFSTETVQWEIHSGSNTLYLVHFKCICESTLNTQSYILVYIFIRTKIHLVQKNYPK